MTFVKADVRRLSFQRSHLRDGTDTNTVDEGTLENLALLGETGAGRKTKKRGRGSEKAYISM